MCSAVIRIRRLKMRRYFFLLLIPLLWGCDRQDSASAAIAQQYQAANGAIDLTRIITDPWDRVCMFGPYSSINNTAEEMDIDWKTPESSNTESDDGANRLVFLSGRDVVAYVVHPRSQGDFSNLSKQCYPRENAKFIDQKSPPEGWPGLFPLEN